MLTLMSDSTNTKTLMLQAHLKRHLLPLRLPINLLNLKRITNQTLYS
jgi:hypothetical protein